MFWLNYFFYGEALRHKHHFFSHIGIMQYYGEQIKCLAQGHDTPIGGFETYCRCILESTGCLSPSRHE